MSSKLQRWVDLLAALLRRNFPVTFAELAREVPAYGRPDQKAEARRRMFERDKDELRGLGIPIETRDISDGELGYALARVEFYLPYLALLREGRVSPVRRSDRYGYRSLPILAFEPDELTAIADAAARVRELGVESLAADARSALRKLGHDLPLPSSKDTPRNVRIGPAGRGADGVFDLFAAALKARKRVTFTYRSMERDSSDRRVIEPYGLFFLGKHWYLAGVEPGQPVVKNFRLSRASEPEMNERAPGTPDYVIPKSFRLADHARSRQAWELGSGDVVEVTVRVARRSGVAAPLLRLGRAVTGGAELRKFQVRRPDAFVRWILGFGGAAVIVEPEGMVAEYRAAAAAALAVYEPGGAA